MNGGDISKIDPWQVVRDAAFGAIAGGVCTAMLPVGSFQKLGVKQGIRIANAMIAAEETMFLSHLYIGPALWFDIGATAVTAFGAWTAGLVCNYYSELLEGL